MDLEFFHRVQPGFTASFPSWDDRTSWVFAIDLSVMFGPATHDPNRHTGRFWD